MVSVARTNGVTIDKLRPMLALGASTLNSAALVTQRKLEDTVWFPMTVCIVSIVYGVFSVNRKYFDFGQASLN